MKDCIFFWSVSCFGLLATLLTLADCGSGGRAIDLLRKIGRAVFGEGFLQLLIREKVDARGERVLEYLPLTPKFGRR